MTTVGMLPSSTCTLAAGNKLQRKHLVLVLWKSQFKLPQSNLFRQADRISFCPGAQTDFIKEGSPFRSIGTDQDLIRVIPGILNFLGTALIAL